MQSGRCWLGGGSSWTTPLIRPCRRMSSGWHFIIPKKKCSGQPGSATGLIGVWETAYNATETGYKDWTYPEFAGYFANVRWLKLTTTEGALTIMIPDEKTFVRVGTPKFPPAKLSGKTMVDFPPGNLAVVRDIPAIGSKFSTAAQDGPQGSTPLVNAPYQGTIYLHFEPAMPPAEK